VTLTVGQLARTITGISEISYAFTIFHAIITAFSIGIYNGARCRFLFQTTLYTLLIVPTSIGGVPFDLVTKSGLIFNALVVDIVMISFYGFFQRKKASTGVGSDNYDNILDGEPTLWNSNKKSNPISS
jgi:hypothetical protein